MNCASLWACPSRGPDPVASPDLFTTPVIFLAFENWRERRAARKGHGELPA
jgi:hypothetical protein